MKIGGRAIGPAHPPYMIAEIGVNHDGSLERAIELVEAAARARADAVKLQYFDADLLLSAAAKIAEYQKNAGAGDPHEMLRSLQLSADDVRLIVEASHEANMHAILTVFSVELVESAAQLNCDAYKTASPDIINKPLIEALIATERPLILSTGAASLHEVDNARQWIEEHPHIFMQCVSAYPTPDEYASLAARRAMARLDPNAIGYSDHTTAIDAGGLAVASGACVLEKHLTYDRRANGPDHAASLEPEHFAEYVRLAHRAWKMLGEEEKKVHDIERDVREVSRQSLTAVRALPAGHVLAREDLTIKRPGLDGSISPSRLDSVLGRRLARRIEANMPLHEDDLT